jgi:hypothetical protein
MYIERLEMSEELLMITLTKEELVIFTSEKTNNTII